LVTGVQTCALPISFSLRSLPVKRPISSIILIVWDVHYTPKLRCFSRIYEEDAAGRGLCLAYGRGLNWVWFLVKLFNLLLVFGFNDAPLELERGCDFTAGDRELIGNN